MMGFDLAAVHVWTGVATGLACLFVAYLVARRQVPAHLRAAKAAFTWWWITVAALTGLGTSPGPLRAHFGGDGALAVSLGALLLITGGSAAIVYYQSVLLGLLKRPGRVVAAYYSVMFLSYTALVVLAGPHYDGRFGSLVYTNTWLAPGGVLHPSLTITYFWFMLGPGLIGTAIHLWATDRLADPKVRDRSYTIAASLFVWYLFVLVGSISILSGAVPPWLLLSARFVNLVAVTMVLMALYSALRHDSPLVASTGAAGNAPGGPTGRKHVLLVDDETPILESLTIILEEFSVSRPQVWHARSGEEAIAQIDARHFDLVVSDYRMNGLTGADVLEHAWKMRPEAVRVLLTGYSEDSVVKDAVERGHVHGYALKPWDTDQMVEDIDRWLEEEHHTEADQEHVLEFLVRGRALI